MLGRPPSYIPNNWFIRAVGSSRLPGLSPYHHTQVVVPAEYCSVELYCATHSAYHLISPHLLSDRHRRMDLGVVRDEVTVVDHYSVGDLSVSPGVVLCDLDDGSAFYSVDGRAPASGRIDIDSRVLAAVVARGAKVRVVRGARLPVSAGDRTVRCEGVERVAFQRGGEA